MAVERPDTPILHLKALFVALLHDTPEILDRNRLGLLAAVLDTLDKRLNRDPPLRVEFEFVQPGGMPQRFRHLLAETD